MFSKVAILATLSLALSVAAAPSGDANCNTQGNYCCNSLQQADTASFAETYKSVLGATVQGLTGQAGVGCSPISVIGVGSGASCTQQPVCCKGNNFNGAVVLGCSPINASL